MSSDGRDASAHIVVVPDAEIAIPAGFASDGLPVSFLGRASSEPLRRFPVDGAHGDQDAMANNRTLLP